jgi:hypothetical protein
MAYRRPTAAFAEVEVEAVATAARGGEMRRWFDYGWYRYLWARRLTYAQKSVIGLTGLAALAGVGFVTVAATAGSGGGAETYVAATLTTSKLVTVREHGKIVTKRVPVLRRIYAKPVTVMEMQTLTTPGGTSVVTRPVVRYRRVVQRDVVTVNGRPVTVSRLVTDTKVLTNTTLVTIANERTATLTQDRTVNQTVSQTVNQTVNRTVTDVQTVTPDPVTVTRTETETVTQPADTVTVVSIVTVTVPVP